MHTHIARGSGCVLCIVRSPNSSYPKIGDSQIAIIIKDQILRFDISMNYVFLMNKLQPGDQARNEKS